MFVSYTNTWYDGKSQSEVLNFLLFSQLERALSTSGLAGLDTLFAFMIATELTVRNLLNVIKYLVQFGKFTCLSRTQESVQRFEKRSLPTSGLFGNPGRVRPSYCANNDDHRSDLFN